MPFFRILGYDFTDPREIRPEYVTDVGIKKGERIDYAIMRDGVPEILIECKCHTEDMSKHSGQLFRYFHVSQARFAVLTNGISYQFYTDTVAPNKMDDDPFLSFNIAKISAAQLESLSKFTKANYSRDSLFDAVRILKHTSDIRAVFQQEMIAPSDDFVKLYANRIYSGNLTARVLQQFTDLTRISINQYINEVVTDRLAAMREQDKIKPPEPVVVGVEPESKINTTQVEMEAYYIIKSIMRNSISSQRITHRDAQSYFSVLIDDNNRRPVCRLYLEGPKMTMMLFNSKAEPTKHELSSLDDLFLYSEQFKAIGDQWASGEAPVASSGESLSKNM